MKKFIITIILGFISILSVSAQNEYGVGVTFGETIHEDYNFELFGRIGRCSVVGNVIVIDDFPNNSNTSFTGNVGGGYYVVDTRHYSMGLGTLVGITNTDLANDYIYPYNHNANDTHFNYGCYLKNEIYFGKKNQFGIANTIMYNKYDNISFSLGVAYRFIN